MDNSKNLKKISNFLSAKRASKLCSTEKEVLHALRSADDVNKADINAIAKTTRMTPTQVKAAMFLLFHKGLIENEEIIDEEK